MKPVRSTYYPPRAGVISRLWGGLWHLRRFRAAARVSRENALSAFWAFMPLKPIPLSQLVLSVLVPGAGVWCRGPARIGRAALWTALALFLVFFVFIGTVVGNIAFGALLCLHATGLVYFLERWIAGARLEYRMLFSVCVLVALLTLLYGPSRMLVERYAITPVRVNGKTAVMRQVYHPEKLKRGDVIAYRTEEMWSHGITVRGGVGLGPVLALAGDKVDFSEEFYAVNGVKHPTLPHMPVSGQIEVPRNHWFVWPQVTRLNSVDRSDLMPQFLLGMSLIREDQIRGREIRWFWRARSDERLKKAKP